MSNKILFVVPTLDSYHLLQDLVSSLESQISHSWRVLFVDGPSSTDHRAWLSNLCTRDSRFSWVEQLPSEKKIFGAMNQGFSNALDDEWILFWGSDDLAFSDSIVNYLLNIIETCDSELDLVIGRGQYIQSNGHAGRLSRFLYDGQLNSYFFRLLLFLGASPPHQATLFSPRSRAKINRYSDRFLLASDLDYFLRISKFNSLRVKIVPKVIVYMSDSGVSGQYHSRRFNEVFRAYLESFGLLFFVPFLLRYFHRVFSIFW